MVHAYPAQVTSAASATTLLLVSRMAMIRSGIVVLSADGIVESLTDLIQSLLIWPTINGLLPYLQAADEARFENKNHD